MNKNNLSQLRIARLTLEAVTPLSVSTGAPDNVFDTALVRDANGLPAIPGTSLTGVLRHLWADLFDQHEVDSLFGFQKGNTGHASRLQVSWGHLLDSNGKAGEGLLLGEQGHSRLQDAIYAEALRQIDDPVFRDRVRLTDRGAAADKGKFDRAVLPAGNRFALEFRHWSSDKEESEEWQRLLALFSHPGFRLGGSTRAGLGRMQVQSMYTVHFDMTDNDSVEHFKNMDRGITAVEQMQAHDNKESCEGWLTATLSLQAKDLWRIGQGDQALDTSKLKPADLLPKVEQRIQWINNKGCIVPAFALLPASSLKGALSHRLAFHQRCLNGQWADDNNLDERPAALYRLLGEVKSVESSGRAGALYLDDAYLATDAVKIARLMHNAIDRFTGGVRNHALFEEESLFGGQVEINIVLNTTRLGDKPDEVRQVLSLALNDLLQGRLALGSRTTTGNGFFNGTLTGPLADWLSDAGKTVSKEVA